MDTETARLTTYVTTAAALTTSVAWAYKLHRMHATSSPLAPSSRTASAGDRSRGTSRRNHKGRGTKPEAGETTPASCGKNVLSWFRLWGRKTTPAEVCVEKKTRNAGRRCGGSEGTHPRSLKAGDGDHAVRGEGNPRSADAEDEAEEDDEDGYGANTGAPSDDIVAVLQQLQDGPFGFGGANVKVLSSKKREARRRRREREGERQHREAEEAHDGRQSRRASRGCSSRSPQHGTEKDRTSVSTRYPSASKETISDRRVPGNTTQLLDGHPSSGLHSASLTSLATASSGFSDSDTFSSATSECPTTSSSLRSSTNGSCMSFIGGSRSPSGSPGAVPSPAAGYSPPTDFGAATPGGHRYLGDHSDASAPTVGRPPKTASQSQYHGGGAVGSGLSWAGGSIVHKDSGSHARNFSGFGHNTTDAEEEAAVAAEEAERIEAFARWAGSSTASSAVAARFILRSQPQTQPLTAAPALGGTGAAVSNASVMGAAAPWRASFGSKPAGAEAQNNAGTTRKRSLWSRLRRSTRILRRMLRGLWKRCVYAGSILYQCTMGPTVEMFSELAVWCGAKLSSAWKWVHAKILSVRTKESIDDVPLTAEDALDDNNDFSAFWSAILDKLQNDTDLHRQIDELLEPLQPTPGRVPSVVIVRAPLLHDTTADVHSLWKALKQDPTVSEDDLVDVVVMSKVNPRSPEAVLVNAGVGGKLNATGGISWKPFASPLSHDNVGSFGPSTASNAFMSPVFLPSTASGGTFGRPQAENTASRGSRVRSHRRSGATDEGGSSRRSGANAFHRNTPGRSLSPASSTASVEDDESSRNASASSSCSSSSLEIPNEISFQIVPAYTYYAYLARCCVLQEKDNELFARIPSLLQRIERCAQARQTLVSQNIREAFAMPRAASLLPQAEDPLGVSQGPLRGIGFASVLGGGPSASTKTLPFPPHPTHRTPGAPERGGPVDGDGNGVAETPNSVVVSSSDVRLSGASRSGHSSSALNAQGDVVTAPVTVPLGFPAIASLTSPTMPSPNLGASSTVSMSTRLMNERSDLYMVPTALASSTVGTAEPPGSPGSPSFRDRIRQFSGSLVRSIRSPSALMGSPTARHGSPRLARSGSLMGARDDELCPDVVPLCMTPSGVGMMGGGVDPRVAPGGPVGLAGVGGGPTRGQAGGAGKRSRQIVLTVRSKDYLTVEAREHALTPATQSRAHSSGGSSSNPADTESRLARSRTHGMSRTAFSPPTRPEDGYGGKTCTPEPLLLQAAEKDVNARAPDVGTLGDGPQWPSAGVRCFSSGPPLSSDREPMDALSLPRMRDHTIAPSDEASLRRERSDDDTIQTELTTAPTTLPTTVTNTHTSSAAVTPKLHFQPRSEGGSWDMHASLADRRRSTIHALTPHQTTMTQSMSSANVTPVLSSANRHTTDAFGTFSPHGSPFGDYFALQQQQQQRRHLRSRNLPQNSSVIQRRRFHVSLLKVTERSQAMLEAMEALLKRVRAHWHTALQDLQQELTKVLSPRDRLDRQSCGNRSSAAAMEEARLLRTERFFRETILAFFAAGMARREDMREGLMEELEDTSFTVCTIPLPDQRVYRNVPPAVPRHIAAHARGFPLQHTFAQEILYQQRVLQGILIALEEHQRRKQARRERRRLMREQAREAKRARRRSELLPPPLRNAWKSIRRLTENTLHQHRHYTDHDSDAEVTYDVVNETELVERTAGRIEGCQGDSSGDSRLYTAKDTHVNEDRGDHENPREHLKTSSHGHHASTDPVENDGRVGVKLSAVLPVAQAVLSRSVAGGSATSLIQVPTLSTPLSDPLLKHPGTSTEYPDTPPLTEPARDSHNTEVAMQGGGTTHSPSHFSTSAATIRANAHVSFSSGSPAPCVDGTNGEAPSPPPVNTNLGTLSSGWGGGGLGRGLRGVRSSSRMLSDLADDAPAPMLTGRLRVNAALGGGKAADLVETTPLSLDSTGARSAQGPPPGPTVTSTSVALVPCPLFGEGSTVVGGAVAPVPLLSTSSQATGVLANGRGAHHHQPGPVTLLPSSSPRLIGVPALDELPSASTQDACKRGYWMETITATNLARTGDIVSSGTASVVSPGSSLTGGPRSPRQVMGRSGTPPLPSLLPPLTVGSPTSLTARYPTAAMIDDAPHPGTPLTATPRAGFSVSGTGAFSATSFPRPRNGSSQSSPTSGSQSPILSGEFGDSSAGFGRGSSGTGHSARTIGGGAGTAVPHRSTPTEGRAPPVTSVPAHPGPPHNFSLSMTSTNTATPRHHARDRSTDVPTSRTSTADVFGRSTAAESIASFIPAVPNNSMYGTYDAYYGHTVAAPQAVLLRQQALLEVNQANRRAREKQERRRRGSTRSAAARTHSFHNAATTAGAQQAVAASQGYLSQSVSRRHSSQAGVNEPPLTHYQRLRRTTSLDSLATVGAPPTNTPTLPAGSKAAPYKSPCVAGAAPGIGPMSANSSTSSAFAMFASLGALPLSHHQQQQQLSSAQAGGLRPEEEQPPESPLLRYSHNLYDLLGASGGPMYSGITYYYTFADRQAGLFNASMQPRPEKTDAWESLIGIGGKTRGPLPSSSSADALPGGKGQGGKSGSTPLAGSKTGLNAPVEDYLPVAKPLQPASSGGDAVQPSAETSQADQGTSASSPNSHKEVATSEPEEDPGCSYFYENDPMDDEDAQEERRQDEARQSRNQHFYSLFRHLHNTYFNTVLRAPPPPPSLVRRQTSAANPSSPTAQVRLRFGASTPPPLFPPSDSSGAGFFAAQVHAQGSMPAFRARTPVSPQSPAGASSRKSTSHQNLFMSNGSSAPQTGIFARCLSALRRAFCRVVFWRREPQDVRSASPMGCSGFYSNSGVYGDGGDAVDAADDTVTFAERTRSRAELNLHNGNYGLTPLEVWLACRYSQKIASEVYVMDIHAQKGDPFFPSVRVVDEVVAHAVLYYHNRSLRDFLDELQAQFGLCYEPQTLWGRIRLGYPVDLSSTTSDASSPSKIATTSGEAFSAQPSLLSGNGPSVRLSPYPRFTTPSPQPSEQHPLQFSAAEQGGPRQHRSPAALSTSPGATSPLIDMLFNESPSVSEIDRLGDRSPQPAQPSPSTQESQPEGHDVDVTRQERRTHLPKHYTRVNSMDRSGGGSCEPGSHTPTPGGAHATHGKGADETSPSCSAAFGKKSNFYKTGDDTLDTTMYYLYVVDEQEDGILFLSVENCLINDATKRLPSTLTRDEELEERLLMHELKYLKEFLLEHRNVLSSASLTPAGSNRLEGVFGAPATVFPFLQCARESIGYVQTIYDSLLQHYGAMTFNGFGKYTQDVFSRDHPEIIRHTPRIFRTLDKARRGHITYEELCGWMGRKLSCGSNLKPDAHLLATTMSLRLPLTLVLSSKSEWASTLECALPSLSDGEGDY